MLHCVASKILVRTTAALQRTMSLLHTIYKAYVLIGASIGRHLAPPGALLIAVANLVRGFTNGEVFLNISAVPAKFLQLHAKGIVLSQGPHWGSTHLQQGIGPYLQPMYDSFT